MGIDLYAEYAEAQQALVVARAAALQFLDEHPFDKRENPEGYERIQQQIAVHSARCKLKELDAFQRFARWEREQAARQERFQNRATWALILLGFVAFLATVFQGWVAYQVYAHPSTAIPAAPPAPPASQSHP